MRKLILIAAAAVLAAGCAFPDYEFASEACGAAGTDCSGGGCCTGLACVTGKCRAVAVDAGGCHPALAYCGNASDCCDGICRSNVCWACLGSGATCSRTMDNCCGAAGLVCSPTGTCQP